jgi:hypothetical protein
VDRVTVEPERIVIRHVIPTAPLSPGSPLRQAKDASGRERPERTPPSPSSSSAFSQPQCPPPELALSNFGLRTRHQRNATPLMETPSRCLQSRPGRANELRDPSERSP